MKELVAVFSESFWFLCPWDFPAKNTGVGLPFPSPVVLPDPGIEPGSPAFQADSLTTELGRKPYVLFT